MRPNFRHLTLLSTSTLILGLLLYAVFVRHDDTNEQSVGAMRTAVRLIEAMNEKDESILEAILAESIVMKAVSGRATERWVLSRPDLIAKVTNSAVKSFDASNIQIYLRGERADVQVFLRTTFNSDELGEFQHMAVHVFTFVVDGEDWELIEITRDDAPLTFWKVFKNAPDLILRKIFGLPPY